MKIRRTDNLHDLLKEQLQFLNASCTSYDNGFTGEAKRIAITIRVLVHQTKNSTSLLKQLNLDGIPFYNSSHKYNPSNLMPHMGLVIMRTISNTNFDYLPRLDNGVPGKVRFDNFQDWWTDIVIKDKKDKDDNLFNRKDIILTVANQEGGGHIDPTLEVKYENLLRKNSIGWIVSNKHNSKPFGSENVQFVMASIRQIGFEMIKTLERYAN